MATVTQYELSDGAIPFQKWLVSLSAKAALKVTTAIKQMEAGNLGDHKSVGEGVWERRIHFEKGYRIYYAQDGNELILLFWGGTKSGQQSDINKAKGYWSDYKHRKKLEQEKKSREVKSPPHKPKRKK